MNIEDKTIIQNLKERGTQLQREASNKVGKIAVYGYNLTEYQKWKEIRNQIDEVNQEIRQLEELRIHQVMLPIEQQQEPTLQLTNLYLVLTQMGIQPPYSLAFNKTPGRHLLIHAGIYLFQIAGPSLGYRFKLIWPSPEGGRCSLFCQDLPTLLEELNGIIYPHYRLKGDTQLSDDVKKVTEAIASILEPPPDTNLAKPQWAQLLGICHYAYSHETRPFSPEELLRRAAASMGTETAPHTTLAQRALTNAGLLPK